MCVCVCVFVGDGQGESDRVWGMAIKKKIGQEKREGQVGCAHGVHKWGGHWLLVLLMMM